MHWRIVAVAVLCTLLAGTHGVAQQGREAALRAAAAAVTQIAVKVSIFGGRDRDEFFGCLTCSAFDSDSVHNDFGTYGNPFSPKSIRNPFGFGNRYNANSPCNEYSARPPILLGADGRSYGELTTNKVRPNRVDSATVTRWLNLACAD